MAWYINDDRILTGITICQMNWSQYRRYVFVTGFSASGNIVFKSKLYYHWLHWVSDNDLSFPSCGRYWGLLHHDDVIKWKHFPRYWPFVQGIHRSPVNSPHKGQWRGALMFSLICTWTNGRANNRIYAVTGEMRTVFHGLLRLKILKKPRYCEILQMPLRLDALQLCQCRFLKTCI